jgi:hypothetical protein
MHTGEVKIEVDHKGTGYEDWIRLIWLRIGTIITELKLRVS